jgi:hypothetical protein
MHLPPVGHVAVAAGVDKHTSLRLYTLTLCVFAIGVAEFLLVGLLPKVASFHPPSEACSSAVLLRGPLTELSSQSVRRSPLRLCAENEKAARLQPCCSASPRQWCSAFQ